MRSLHTHGAVDGPTLAASVIDKLSEAVVIAEAESGRVVFANPSAERLFGSEPGGLLQVKLATLLGVDEHGRGYAEQLARGVSESGGWYTEGPLCCPSAATRVCAFRCSKLLHAELGALWVLHVTDISEAVRERRAREGTEILLRSALESPGVGYFVLDGTGAVVDANAEYVRVTGHKRLSDIVRRRVFEWTAARDVEVGKGALARCLVEGGTVPFTLSHVGPDGAEYPLEICGHRADWMGAVRVVGVSRDLSEPRRVARSLAEAEARVRVILRTTPSAIFVAGPSGDIVEANPAALRLFGYETEVEVIGRPVRTLSPDCEPLVAACSSCMLPNPPCGAGNSQCSTEGIATRRGGHGIPVEITVARADTEHASMFVLMFRDLSSLRSAELAAETMRSELLHASRVWTLGELATGIAHELNQPLAAIRTNLETARRQRARGALAPDELDAILEDVWRDAVRAGDVVGHMRALLSKGVTSREAIEVGALFRQILGLVRVESLSLGVRVVVEVTAPDPILFVDRVLMQQAVLNLVTNAIRAVGTAATAGRNVYLRAEQRSSGVVCMEVADEGPGIPRERLPTLFRPFYATTNKGMGLGLALSRRIVEAHGGTLELVSPPDTGCVFRICLPPDRRNPPIYPPSEG